MKVEIGNADAIEAYQDRVDGPWIYREYPGEHITTLMIPDERSLAEAASDVVVTLSSHMMPGAVPKWVESDRPELKTVLCQHYRIPEAPKPPSWGSGFATKKD